MTVASRREREQQMRRQMILEAALQLFTEKGFNLTTVDEIAAQAELGKGTIYSYFKSKDEIYLAILQEGMEILQRRMEQAIDNPNSAVEALYSLYDTFTQYHRERLGFIETLFMQVDERTAIRLGDLVHGLQDKASNWSFLVGKVLQWGIDRGEFVEFEVEKVAKAIVGLIIGLIFQYEMGQIQGDLADYRKTVLKLALEGIIQEKQYQLV